MNLKLYMLLLGCKPSGRLTEQHDIFFGIAQNLKELLPSLKSSWPEAKGVLHIDVWREVTKIDSYKIHVVERKKLKSTAESQNKLFFINLGGYKKDEFEEYHYKMLVVAKDKGEAIYQSKESNFYRHTGFAGATSHVDDKYGIDVDDIYELQDCLPEHMKELYRLEILDIHENPEQPEDELHAGYLKLSSLK